MSLGQSLQAWRESLEGTSGPTPGVPRTVDGWDSPNFSLQRIREIMSGRLGVTPGVGRTLDGYDSPNYSAQAIREILTARPGLTPGVARSHDGYDEFPYSLQAIREVLTGQPGATSPYRTMQGYDPPEYSAALIAGQQLDGTTAITLAGGEITDTIRAAALQGDGRASPDYSMGIYDARTNLITNGGFESNNTGWIESTGGTIPRSTTRAKFGAASGEWTMLGGTLAAVRFDITVAAAGTYSASVWVWIPTAATYTALQFRFLNFTGATGTTSVQANMALRDQWQLLRIPNVGIVAGDLAGSLQLFTSAGTPAAGEKVWLDGLQLELGNTASPYIETNGGTASRLNGGPTAYADTLGLRNDRGWVAARIRARWANAAEPPFPRVWDIRTDPAATNNLFVSYQDGVNSWLMQRTKNGTTQQLLVAGTVAFDQQINLVATWSPTGISLSVDGGAFSTLTVQPDNLPDLTAALLHFGWHGGSTGGVSVSRHGFLDMMFIAGGQGVLTQANATALHALLGGNRTAIRMSSLPGLPTFYWLPETATAHVRPQAA